MSLIFRLPEETKAKVTGDFKTHTLTHTFNKFF